MACHPIRNISKELPSPILFFSATFVLQTKHKGNSYQVADRLQIELAGRLAKPHNYDGVAVQSMHYNRAHVPWGW